MTYKIKIPEGLLESVAADSGKLHELGIQIGKIYTDHGLPIDIAFDKLSFPKEHKTAILNGALHWLVLHKRNSGATEKAIERQRKLNRDYMEKFIETGEVGLY
jgi:hypothetical protein